MTTENRLKMINARTAVLNELESNSVDLYSPALIRELMRGLEEPPPKPVERLTEDSKKDRTRDIVFLTARVFGVPVSTLFHRTRTGSVVDARHASVYLI